MSTTLESINIKYLSWSEIETIAPLTLVCDINESKNKKQLNLPELGVNVNSECSVCPTDEKYCPGHFSKLLLDKYILNPFQLKNVFKVFSYICLQCKSIANNANAKYCFDCKVHLPDTVTLDYNPYNLVAKQGSHTVVYYTMEDCIQILSSVDATHILEHEYNYEHYIVKYIIVIPPIIRSNSEEDNDSLTDSITLVYSEMMSIIAQDNKKDFREKIAQKYNTILGLCSKDNSKKYLKQRLSSKDGFFRKFSLGKRTDYCARSVIIPNVDLGIDEIGIPEKLAKDLKVMKQDNVIERIKDGDYVMINRQPTLNKTSILFLKAKIVYDTFAINMNPILATPLNGDFDGDEISIYSIVTLDAINEVDSKLFTKHNLVFNNDLTLKLDQNSISALYILSTNIKPISGCDNFREVMKRYRKTITPINIDTRFLISSTLPNGFYFNYSGVVIENGIFISGILTKPVIVEMLKQILFIYDKDIYMKHLRLIQKTTDKWLKHYGLTIGIQECIMPEDKNLNVSFPSNMSMLEKKSIANSIKLSTEEAALEYIEHKGLFNIVSSKSKGDKNNIGQILYCVGQQYVMGEFLPSNNLYNSTFITSSYTKGLSAMELFMHSQMGREGIIKTAVSTADTGYGQRVLIKFLEGLNINDNKITDFNGNIVNFDTSKMFPKLLKQDPYQSEEMLFNACKSILASDF